MLHCFIHVAEKSQLFMSVQSDLYDIMFDWFEYKEQVTTSDPYHCKIPLCLTEHSSLAIKYNPPTDICCPTDACIYKCSRQLSKMKGEGLLLHLSYAALLPNPLPLGACGQSLGAAELLNLGSRQRIPFICQHRDPRGFPCPASRNKDTGKFGPCDRDPSFIPHGPGKLHHLLYRNKDCEFYW